MLNIRILSYLIIIFTCLSINTVFSNENKILGKSAAPFSLFKISDDKYYRIKDVIGKKNVVISFFGTWCGPCRKEIPELQKISNKLSKDNYEFLLICVSNIKPPGSSKSFKEKIPTIKNFIKKLDVDMEVIFDKYNVVWRKYADLEKGSFPLTVVINKKGKISYHKHGYKSGDEKKLENHLKSL